VSHPNAYTDEEHAFLQAIVDKPMEISAADYERVVELLGRAPTYEVDAHGKLDHSKPIVVNSRFQNAELARAGVEHVLLAGRPVTPKPETEPPSAWVRHKIGPVKVDDPKRPMDWDAYVWQAFAHCERCNASVVSEYWIPGHVLHLIPSEKRDEAMRVMAEFAKKRLESIAHYNDGDEEMPECKPR